MAYGTDEGVTLIVGGKTEFITTDNITAAIAMSDGYVDNINSSATSAQKAQASNEIAGEICLQGEKNARRKTPDTTPFILVIPERIYELLGRIGPSFATTGE